MKDDTIPIPFSMHCKKGVSVKEMINFTLSSIRRLRTMYPKLHASHLSTAPTMIVSLLHQNKF